MESIESMRKRELNYLRVEIVEASVIELEKTLENNGVTITEKNIPNIMGFREKVVDFVNDLLVLKAE